MADMRPRISEGFAKCWRDFEARHPKDEETKVSF